jgi:hypothetical protein
MKREEKLAVRYKQKGPSIAEYWNAGTYGSEEGKCRILILHVH